VLPDEASGQSPGTPRQRGKQTIPVQGGYGTCFCSPGTNFTESWRDRGTSLIETVNLSPCKNWLRALAQYRGKICLGARNLSRFIEFKLHADERVRVQEPLQICLECRSKSKNRDKQLTHIVRVIRRSI